MSGFFSRLAALLVVLMSTVSAYAADDTPQTHDRWYVIEMQGQRAGHMRDWRRMDEQGRLVSGSEITFKLARLGAAMTVSMRNSFVETMDGEPVSMTSVQNLGMGEVKQEYTFEGEQVKVVTTQGGRVTDRTAPKPAGEWLTPGETERFVEARLRAGAQEIKFASVDPSTGLVPVGVTHKVIERTHVEAMGKTVPAVKWSSEQSLMPNVESIEYVDESGTTIRSELNLGGISMTVLAADKEIATSDFSAPELMAATLVKPDHDIVNPRGLRNATYKLSVTSGEMPQLPDAAAQDVEAIDHASARVRVSMDIEPAAANLDEDVKAAMLARSTNVDISDPKIKELVEQALKGAPEGANAAQQAETMRRFVHSYIKAKNLGVGFATASEVARTREGDCSEHAVLLVAMLRSAGIPARGVSGLLYVDQFHDQIRVFGYHMWAQALLEIGGVQRWVDLDPVLPGSTPFDATHIALSVSDLSDDGVVNSMVPLATVLGRLKIEVEKTGEK